MRKSKRFLVVAAATILSFSGTLVTSCGNEEVIDATKKTMTVSGPTSIAVGKKGTLVVKEGETVLTGGLVFESSDASIASVSASGEVSGVKEGKITIKVSKEGYNNASLSITITKAPDVTPDTLIRTLTKDSFPLLVAHLGEETYPAADFDEKVGETTFTFKAKGLGFASTKHNTTLATDIKAFQVKKAQEDLVTSPTLTLTKVVLEQVTTYKDKDVLTVDLKLGGVAATPTLGKLEDTGLVNVNGQYNNEIFKQVVTYTFPEGTEKGALTLSGNSAGVAYFSSMSLYGVESVAQ